MRIEIKDIVSILADEGVGIVGESLFVNMIPADKNGIMLKEPGFSAQIDYEMPKFRKFSFQVIARGQDYEQTKDLMFQAMEALTIEEDQEVGDLHIKYMRPRHEPIVFPPSPSNSIEFLVNIDVCAVIV